MKNSVDKPLPRSQVASLLGLVSLAAAPHILHLEPWVFGFFAVIILLRLFALNQPKALPGRFLLLLLTIGGGVNVFSHYQTFLGRDAGVALLTVMLALKLLELKTDRDVYLAIFLTYFLVVTQFLFDQSMLLAGYMFLVVLGLTALLVELNRAGSSRSFLPSLARSLSLLLQALPVMLVLFLFFPRLTAPLWNLDINSSSAVSGLSGRLTPGTVSRLSLSRAVAFRVEFEGDVPPPTQRYWRGPVLWETDGASWSPGQFASQHIAELRFVGRGNPLRYRVTMEPSRQQWLFALDLPAEVPGQARLTSDFQILSEAPITDNRHYGMTSYLSYHTGSLSEDERRLALQLPGNLTPRMTELVKGWKQGPEASAPDLIEKALTYFNQEPFVYTLTPPLLGENPADQFLFDTRRGFCEHFATSFTLLMRIAGIPSRVVTGYQGGEFNPHGDYLIVRQADAHAWSEVWLEETGWQRVDPTAAVAPERIERPIDIEGILEGAPVRFQLADPGVLRGLFREMGFVVDALHTGWRRWVLDYGVDSQLSLLSGLGLDFLKRQGLPILMILLSAVILTTLASVLATRGRRRADPVVRLYGRYCDRMATAGLTKKPHEGPRDFAARARRARPDWDDYIRQITDIYLALRYGRVNGAVHLRRLRRLIGRLG